MNYFVHYQNQAYDPSSQAQGSYDQSTNNFYPYSYPYPNPQFSTSNINPYSHPNPIGQPSQHQEQEPNPPGVTPPPPPAHGNSYYQYQAHGTAAGVPTLGTQPGAVVHQPIVQPLYGGVGNMGGTVPIADPQIHLDPKLNALSYHPFHVSGHGRGHAFPMNAAVPFHDQTVIAHSGFHIQGGPSHFHSQSFGETQHGPRPKSSGRTSHVRGRGRGGGRGGGRGKGHVPRKHAAAPTRELQAKPEILGGESQPMAEPGASSSGQKIVPLQGPAPSVVLPPPKAVSCELCKIECNSLEILQQHMNGKKHKKKVKVLEELQNLNKGMISGQTEETAGVELKSEVALSQPDPVEVLPSQEMNEESEVAAGEKRKAEDIEPPPGESSKKRRVFGSKRKGKNIKKKRVGTGNGSKSLVEAPKAKESAAVPLVCELCNVKCESVVVFQSHLVGKKHKSKAERFMGQQMFGLPPK